MKCLSYYSFFENFSNETRIKIVFSLMESPKSVNDISKDIKEEQSKVSHNLKRLMECNFLTFSRHGKKRVYSLNKDTIVPLIRLVDEHVKKYCSEVCKR